MFEGFLKANLEANQRVTARPRYVPSFLFVPTQQILSHGRHQCSREQIRSKHGEHNRFRQRHEQISSDTGQKEHRNEHNADAFVSTLCICICFDTLHLNIGTNTMQMQSVETNAGTAICCAPSRIACFISLPMARLRSMFSISTVASSTRMPTASASPPSVMMLMVSPSALSRITETKIDKGIETAMIKVGRQSPRKIRIMTAVRQAAIRPSRKTP